MIFFKIYSFMKTNNLSPWILLSSLTKLVQKKKIWRLKIFVKFWTVPALINVSYPPKLSTKVPEKTHNVTDKFCKCKTLLILNPSENHSKNVSIKVFLYKIRFETHHLLFQNEVSAVMLAFYPQFINKKMMEWRVKENLVVTAKDPNALSCIVNVFKKKYFVIKTVIATTVEIISKTQPNINRQ